MKGGSETMKVPAIAEEQYPYPLWSPDELTVLYRWYHALGAKECAERWQSLTGRVRTVEQMCNKTARLGLQNEIDDDVLELFQ